MLESQYVESLVIQEGIDDWSGLVVSTVVEYHDKGGLELGIEVDNPVSELMVSVVELDAED